MKAVWGLSWIALAGVLAADSSEQPRLLRRMDGPQSPSSSAESTSDFYRLNRAGSSSPSSRSLRGSQFQVVPGAVVPGSLPAPLFGGRPLQRPQVSSPILNGVDRTPNQPIQVAQKAAPRLELPHHIQQRLSGRRGQAGLLHILPNLPRDELARALSAQPPAAFQGGDAEVPERPSSGWRQQRQSTLAGASATARQLSHAVSVSPHQLDSVLGDMYSGLYRNADSNLPPPLFGQGMQSARFRDSGLAIPHTVDEDVPFDRSPSARRPRRLLPALPQLELPSSAEGRPVSPRRQRGIVPRHHPPAFRPPPHI